MSNGPASQLRVLTFVLAIFLIFFMAFACFRMVLPRNIDPNEGWNTMHTAKVLAGKNLYQPLDGLLIIPLNYPPLSFFVTAGLNALTGVSVLFVGRWLAFVSFIAVGLMVGALVRVMTNDRFLAVWAAVFWWAMTVRVAENYVGLFDPQFLGHVFSVAALYTIIKHFDHLSWRNHFLAALFISISVFSKHLLVAVPVAVGIYLFWMDRKHCVRFIMANVAIAVVFLLGFWWYGGNTAFSNFLGLSRPTSLWLMRTNLRMFFLQYGGWVLFIPFVGNLGKRGAVNLVLCFWAVSLLIGVYAVRGVGVDVNAWFDLLIASALLAGVFPTGGNSAGNRGFFPVS